MKVCRTPSIKKSLLCKYLKWQEECLILFVTGLLCSVNPQKIVTMPYCLFGQILIPTNVLKSKNSILGTFQDWKLSGKCMFQIFGCPISFNKSARSQPLLIIRYWYVKCTFAAFILVLQYGYERALLVYKIGNPKKMAHVFSTIRKKFSFLNFFEKF